MLINSLSSRLICLINNIYIHKTSALSNILNKFIKVYYLFISFISIVTIIIIYNQWYLLLPYWIATGIIVYIIILIFNNIKLYLEYRTKSIIIKLRRPCYINNIFAIIIYNCMEISRIINDIINNRYAYNILIINIVWIIILFILGLAIVISTIIFIFNEHKYHRYFFLSE